MEVQVCYKGDGYVNFQTSNR